MAVDLKIGIIADYTEGVKGLNKVTASVDSLRKQLLDSKTTSEEFYDAISRDLQVIGRHGQSISSLTKQYELLTKQQKLLALEFGTASEQYRTVAAAAERYAAKIANLRQAEQDRENAIKKHKEALAEAAYEADMFGKAFSYNERESLEYAKRLNAELEKQRQNIAQANAKNADLGFMVLQGDEIGIANYTLKEYESTLKQVIADTGINSEETKKAYAAYEQQRVVVERLNETNVKHDATVKKLNTSTRELVQTQDRHGLKLLSVAKNILKFQLLMGPITAAVRGFKNLFSESVKVAAESEQVFNKLATVFGTVSTQADRMASSLSSVLGVAESTSASALATVGDLLQAQGMGTGTSLSTAAEWVKQFQDIIAFKDINMSLEEFAQNFMSGAAGNLRNFRTFGSIVKESAVNARLAAEGLDKLTGTQIELAKMTTRASIALEQQANSMGATEREWDTMLSINRRLSESTKQLKENFGNWLNESLKPIKTIWIEILDTINDAVASSRYLPQFQQNMQSANPAVLFSRSTNADLWERESRLHTGGWANMYGMLSEATDAGEISKLESNLRYEAQQIVRMFVSFGMTVDEGIAALQEDYITMQALTDDWYGELDIFGGFIEYLGKYSEWAKRMLGRSEWDMETENVGTGFENYLESLRLLTGAGNISAGETMNANSHMSFAKQMAIAARDAAEQALNGINAADLTEFVDAVSLALGEATEEDMVKGKAETLKDLYSILFNQFTQDKTLQENADLLERIANEYKEITGEVIEVNNSLSEFEKALGQMRGNTSSYDVQIAQLRMTDDQKATDNLRRQYEAAYALATTEDEQRQINEAYEEAEQTLLAFLLQQKIYNDELKDEADEKERLAKYKDAVKTINESTADYINQLAQVGMTEEEKALDNLRIAYEKMRSELTLSGDEASKLDDEYKEQRAALIALQAKLKEYNDFLASEAAKLEAAMAAVNAMRNADSARSVMASFQQNISGLQATGKYASAISWRAGQMSSLRSTEAQLLSLGVAASDVNDWIAKMIPIINEEYEARKKSIDLTEEELKQKEAEERRQAGWDTLQGKALGSMGMVGNAISTFSDDQGDIWSDILNVCLDIFTQSQEWSKVVDILDRVVTPLLPLVDGIANMLASLNWFWDIAITVMRVTASVVAGIMRGVEYVLDVFQWLWDNLKVALNNIYQAIIHPITKGNQQEYKELASYWEDTNKTYDEILNKIWTDMPKENDNLDVLQDLYDRNIINEDQFYAGARVVQADKVFDPVTATGYISKRQVGTVTYGNVTITINGGDPLSVENAVYKAMVKAGYPVNAAIGGM